MKLASLVIMAFGVTVAFAGGYSIVRDIVTAGRYASASAEFVTDAAAGNDVDWDALMATNSDICAWVRVTNTDINHPVCLASDEDPEYYLTHDFWDNYELAGCPYLDHRCKPDGPHCMVFGHHMNTGGMFSELYRCHEQEEFDRVLERQALLWSTPASGTVTLRPVCALTVDKTFEDIQWFEFASAGEMCDWLADIDTCASAHASESDAIIATADRVVTLVTCSSMLAGQRDRTLVVFAGSL